MGGEIIEMSGFKAYRIKAGLTQKDVAEFFHISQVSVWQWENGNLPRADKLPAIAELYHCTIDQLLEKEESA